MKVRTRAKTRYQMLKRMPKTAGRPCPSGVTLKSQLTLRRYDTSRVQRAIWSGRTRAVHDALAHFQGRACIQLNTSTWAFDGGGYPVDLADIVTDISHEMLHCVTSCVLLEDGPPSLWRGRASDSTVHHRWIDRLLRQGVSAELKARNGVGGFP